MKNLITILFLMISVFGFSQKTLDTINITKSIDVDTTHRIINVNIGDTIIIINSDTKDPAFSVDTNGISIFSSRFASTSGNDTIYGRYNEKKYIVSNSTKNIEIYAGPNTSGYHQVIDFNILDTTVSGINEISNKNTINISIFPNPAKSDLTVKSDTKIEKIEVINGVGQVVKTANLTNSEIFEFKLNIEDLTNGLYFVRVNDSEVQKLIISK